MTATLEQVQSEWRKLIEIAQQGEDVMILSQGRVIARLTGVHQSEVPPASQPWLEKLAGLRESTATGKLPASTDEILADLRMDRH